MVGFPGVHRLDHSGVVFMYYNFDVVLSPSKEGPPQREGGLAYGPQAVVRRYDLSLRSGMADDRLSLTGGGDAESGVGTRDAEIAATRGFARGLTSAKVGIGE